MSATGKPTDSAAELATPEVTTVKLRCSQPGRRRASIDRGVPSPGRRRPRPEAITHPTSIAAAVTGMIGSDERWLAAHGAHRQPEGHLDRGEE